MMAEMPYRVYQEWVRYADLEPFGHWSLRLGFAIASAVNVLGSYIVGVMAALGNKKARHHKVKYEPWDFIPEGKPKLRDRKPEQNGDAQWNQIVWGAQMMGWEIVDKRKDKRRAKRD